MNYVFRYSPSRLVAYHFLIMNEMKKRGYKPDEIWYNPNYRGKVLGEQINWARQDIVDLFSPEFLCDVMIYPEHDDEYLQECLDNLRGKGICINLN